MGKKWYDDLLDIAQGVGTAALASTGPVGAVIATSINAFLDDDEEKVTPDTPIETVKAKFDKLPPAAQEKVAQAHYSYLSDEKKYDAQIKTTTLKENTKEAIEREKTDRVKGAVRPWVVKWAAVSLFAVTTLASIGVLIVAYQKKEYPDGSLILSLTAVQAWVITEYFKRRSQDKVTMHQHEKGEAITPIPTGILGSVIGGFVGKK